MRSAAFVQLGCIGLHPAPNAAGIHLDTTFGQQFGDVLVGERIPEIPAHAQNDHFSRVLAPFERIVQVDRHGILLYQDAGSEVRNRTPKITPDVMCRAFRSINSRRRNKLTCSKQVFDSAPAVLFRVVGASLTAKAFMRNWQMIPFLLLAGLALSSNCAGATDPNTVLILVNDLVPPETGTGSTGASVYVGQYYAARRGIPLSNIVHLSVRLACCDNDPKAWDSWNIDWQTFDTSIRTPLKSFLESNGLTTTIKYIVPTYGIPLRTRLGAPYPAGLEPDSVSVDSFLTTLYAGTDAPFLLNPYAVSQPAYSKNHFDQWRNPQGWPMYLVSRLDGPGATVATGLVDKAIAAETTVGKNDGIGYFDYQHNGNYPVTDGTMIGAYNLAVAQGLRAVLDDQSIAGHMIHSAPQALWAWGWYSGPFDWDGYEVVNGAVGAPLTSYTPNTITALGTPGTWVPLWLLAGITATWGATGEPYTSGYANGDNLLNHFW